MAKHGDCRLSSAAAHIDACFKVIVTFVSFHCAVVSSYPRNLMLMECTGS